jgi:hypothetical protein
MGHDRACERVGRSVGRANVCEKVEEGRRAERGAGWTQGGGGDQRPGSGGHGEVNYSKFKLMGHVLSFSILSLQSAKRQHCSCVLRCAQNYILVYLG